MNRIVELEKLIRHHKALYYQGRPEISDVKFDKLEDELRSLDPSNKTLEIVGSTLGSKTKKVKHDTKMLSLSKTYKSEELLKWKGDEDLVSTFKIDGISCSLIYKNGELDQAKTRGDGTYGEDITSKVQWLDTVPGKIELKGKVEIRGELFIRESNFFSCFR